MTVRETCAYKGCDDPVIPGTEICPKHVYKFHIEPCNWGGLYGRCNLESGHFGRHSIPPQTTGKRT